MEEDKDSGKLDKITRPWLVSIICIAFFVHAAVLAILFLSSIFFNSWLSEVINNFNDKRSFENSTVFLLSLIGFILYSILFLGTFYLWKMRKKGFYIMTFSAIFILFLSFLIDAGSWINSIIYVILLLILALFYKKLI